MSNSMVQFHDNGAEFVPENMEVLADWIFRVVTGNSRTCALVNFIFCSDSILLEINAKYLGHDYFTDVITFDNSIDDRIFGDIFISVDRIKENAGTYGVPFNHELHRIMVHGVLHLLGFDDKTSLQKNEIREKEDYWLSLLSLE